MHCSEANFPTETWHVWWTFPLPVFGTHTTPAACAAPVLAAFSGWNFLNLTSPNGTCVLLLCLLHCSEWDFLKESIVDKGELTTVEVPYTKVLRFINKLAGAIHRAEPTAKVTVGAHSTPYITNINMPNLWYDNAPMNFYSDAGLVSFCVATTPTL
jgi:hypothetical protein